MNTLPQNNMCSHLVVVYNTIQCNERQYYTIQYNLFISSIFEDCM